MRAFGWTTIEAGEAPDWHRDPGTGLSWPLTFWADVVALLGAGLYVRLDLGMSLAAYHERLLEVITVDDLMHGLGNIGTLIVELCQGAVQLLTDNSRHALWERYVELQTIAHVTVPLYHSQLRFTCQAAK